MMLQEPDEGTYTREQIYSMAADLDQHLTNVDINRFMSYDSSYVIFVDAR